MPQPINFTNATNDFAELNQMVNSMINFGILHEDMANEIEQLTAEAAAKSEIIDVSDYDGDFNEALWEMQLSGLFEESKDKERFVELFRNAIALCSYSSSYGSVTAEEIME